MDATFIFSFCRSSTAIGVVAVDSLREPQPILATRCCDVMRAKHLIKMSVRVNPARCAPRPGTKNVVGTKFSAQMRSLVERCSRSHSNPIIVLTSLSHVHSILVRDAMSRPKLPALIHEVNMPRLRARSPRCVVCK